MAKNNNLTQAKKAKNDEFYTLISDIEKELKHYKKYFEGKVVYCNCDDPEESNFWKFFELNFEEYMQFSLLVPSQNILLNWFRPQTQNLDIGLIQ